MMKSYFSDSFEYSRVMRYKARGFLKLNHDKAVASGTYSNSFLQRRILDADGEEMVFLQGIPYIGLRLLSLDTVHFSLEDTDMLQDTMARTNKERADYIHLSEQEYNDYRSYTGLTYELQKGRRTYVYNAERLLARPPQVPA
jgi:hypothetical protein